MADDSDSGEKTEEPTARRLGDARKKGMVGQSYELSSVLGMAGAFYALTNIAPQMWQEIQVLLHLCFSSDFTRQHWTIPDLHARFIALIWLILPRLLYIMLIAAFIGSMSTLLQTNFLLTWSKVKPKFNMINPLNGLKRIFSAGNFINLLKQIAKLAIIGPIAYSAYWGYVPQFFRMMDVPITDLLPLTANMASDIFVRMMKLLIVLAIGDAIYSKMKFRKSMMMSKHAVKDERKSVEGDETMRRKIISMGLQRARERMMRNVPKADVVVTNPTHIAVAIQYSAIPGVAPKVIAKGKGHLAERIKEIARRHGVPVLERKPLARALFASVEVDHEIPYELFKAVAEVLAYVYRLKGKSPFTKKTTQQGRRP